MKYIIVARYLENTMWAHKLPPEWHPYIVDKSNGFLKNYPGREAHSYLLWITQVYALIKDDDEIVFCQGNPFDHEPDFLKKLVEGGPFAYVFDCDSAGRPQCDYTLCDEYCRVLGLPVQQRYRFYVGALLRVTGEQIKRRSKDWYEALLALTKIDPKSAYTCERLWSTIFELNA